jgi:hypothetical protein
LFDIHFEIWIIVGLRVVQQEDKLEGIPYYVVIKAKMIYCCGNNLVQAETNNANGFDEMAYMLWISSYHMKQVYLRMSARHKVIHIKWSHLKSLLGNQGRSRWIS